MSTNDCCLQGSHWARYLMIAVLLVLLLFPGRAAKASGVRQQTSPGLPVWSPWINLSSTPGGSIKPAITADLFGFVHVFWSEKMQGEPGRFPGREAGDTILYQRLYGGQWTDAIDIAFTQDDIWFNDPDADTDSSGRIYLVWSGYRGLYFASAPIKGAWSAANWRKPMRIIETNPGANGIGPVSRPKILIDESRNVLHVVYSLLGIDGGLYYVRSEDSGVTWSLPLALVQLPAGAGREEAHSGARIKHDSSGRIHLVWSQFLAPDFIEKHVWYSRSDDGGSSWTPPFELSHLQPDDVWQAAPALAVAGDAVHLVWTCGQRPYRCYRMSPDGGHTWRPMQRLFGTMESLAGWDTVTVDSLDRVHIVAQLRKRAIPGIFYSFETDSVWPSSPQDIPCAAVGICGGHFMASAISLGNELHVVTQHESLGEIWYTSAQLDSPAVEALPLPETMVTPTAVVVTPTSSFAVEPVSTPEVAGTSYVATNPTNISEKSNFLPVILGTAASFAIVLLAVFIQLLGRSRG